MSTYRADLPERPARICRLPLDARGFPVPWFVHWNDDGTPDFRVVGPGKMQTGYRGQCWICGEQRGRYHAFVLGPMCGVNRVSAEPPAHLECAEYAVKACPFLTRPLAARNERGLEGMREPAGDMIKRNPGVTLVWVTREFRAFKVDNGQLIRIGDPVQVQLWREGRAATRDEVDESVRTGLPLLAEPAAAQGPKAVAELNRLFGRFTRILDAHYSVA